MSDLFATKADLISIAQDMTNKINLSCGASLPIGSVVPFMGVTAPQDFLACDGTVYNISDYPALASFFEAQFGSKNKFGGDGTTTFAVPDLRGEFLRGTGTNGHSGQGNGGSVGDHQDSTAIMSSFSNGTDYVLAVMNEGANPRVANHDSDYGTGIGRLTLTGTTASQSGGNMRTVRPTNTSVLYIIKSQNSPSSGLIDYSTSERVVGTWIGGEVLYQKTVTTGGSVPTGATLIERTVQTGYDTLLYTKAS